MPRQVISIPATIGLAILIIKKGANVGVKALYFVIGILFVSILLFFLGKTEHSMSSEFSFLTAELRNRESFFVVFAIVLMTLIYLFINYYHKTRKGLEAIFANTIFQLNRNTAFKLLNWISYKYGCGTDHPGAWHSRDGKQHGDF